MDEMEAMKALAEEGGPPAGLSHAPALGGAYLVPEEAARQLSAQVLQLGRIVAVLEEHIYTDITKVYDFFFIEDLTYFLVNIPTSKN